MAPISDPPEQVTDRIDTALNVAQSRLFEGTRVIRGTP